MKCLIAVFLGVSVIISGLIVCAILFGRAISSPETITRHTPNCAQPCWHDIQIGVTSATDAYQILRSDPAVDALIRNDPSQVYPCEFEWKMQLIPFFNGCLVSHPGQPVSSIIFRYDDPQLLLADVIAEFGAPSAAELCHRYYDFKPRYREYVFALVYFASGLTVVAHSTAPNLWRVDPAMRVIMVRYEKPGVSPLYPTNAPRWRGFGGTALYGDRCTY